MPKLREKKTGQEWSFSSDEYRDALASGLYDEIEGETATVVSRATGLAGEVPASELGQRVGVDPETGAQFRAREDSARMEREHGGAVGGALTAAEGLLQGGTLGLYGAAADKILGPEYTQNRKEREAVHPGTAVVSNVAGAILPIVATGGAGAVAEGGALRTVARAMPTAAVERLGARAGVAAGGGIRGAAVAAGVEGGVSSLVMNTAELIESDDPLTLDTVASTLSSNFLLMTGGGALAGAAFKSIEKGIVRVGTKAEAAAEAATRSTTPETAGIDDIADVKVAREAHTAEGTRLKTERAATVAELEAEHAAEVAAIKAERAAAGPDIAAELDALHRDVQQHATWSIAQGAEAGTVTSRAGGATEAAVRDIRNLTDNPKYLAENPGVALKPLQKHEHALETFIQSEGEIRGQIAKDVVAAEKAAAEAEAAAQATAKKAAKARVDLQEAAEAHTTARTTPKPERGAPEQARIAHKEAIRSAREGEKAAAKALAKAEKEAVEAAEAATAAQAAKARPIGEERLQALAEAPALLERNRALQAKVVAAADKVFESARSMELKAAIQATKEAEIASPRLAALEGKIDDLRVPVKKGKLRTAMEGVAFGASSAAAYGTGLGIVSPYIGKEVAEFAGNLLFGRIGKANLETSKRIAGAIDAFLGVARPAARPAIAGATRLLSNLSYGEPGTPPLKPQKPTKDPLLAAYRAREAELYSQVAVGPDGKMRMTPEARAKVHNKIKGLAAVSLKLADWVETNTARRVEYLASKLPKRPDAAARQFGPETWHPSAMQIAEFARHAAAVEDPASAFERMVDGSMTPEDASALRSVYPEMYKAGYTAIIENLPKLQHSLPYHRRVMLSLLTGIPVDPAMDPVVLTILQQGYAQEPGTEGGTQSPMPNPQMGSIKKPDPTPGQSRAAGRPPA